MKSLRNTIHGIVSVLLWIVFIRYWHIVMQQPMNPDTRTAIATLASLAFLTAVYLVVWVYYNIRLSRKHQRRKTRMTTATDPLQDYMGRWIVVDHPEALPTANYIEIELRQREGDDETVEEKVFRTSRRAGGAA